MKGGDIFRIRVLSGGVLALGLLLLGKLFLVQIVHGQMYSQQADGQYVTDQSQTYDRGTIFFSKKDGTLISSATLRSGYTLAINPALITDVPGTYAKLSAITPIDKSAFFLRASKKEDPYEEIVKQLDEETGAGLKALNIKGVVLAPEKWRFYPGGELAAQTLGFVGYKDNTLLGRYGLERYYNDILQRGNDKLYVNFFAEVFSNVSDLLKSNSENNREGDIITTIEPSVQNVLEEQLKAIQDKWHTDSIGGIIINPTTGEVYALGSLPTFDPNHYNTVSDDAVFQNPLVENTYEMGSTVKPLTMAIGLDTGAVTAATTYDDKGYVMLDGARLNNYDFRGRGVVPMQEVLNQSLNTGVVFVMQKTGKEVFRDYMYKFGMVKPSGIDLPNDVKPLASNLKSPRMVEYGTASFGQGIAVTPFTMVRALSVLANGGTLVAPHVVKKIDYTSGLPQEIQPVQGERVIKKTTSDEITRMLVEVVDTALLKGKVKMDHYSIAVKTGTAQIADPKTGKYYDDRYLHSFFGYFPAYNPKFLVFLYAVNPKKVQYASETLTYPFMDITKFLINYYDIPPDR